MSAKVLVVDRSEMVRDLHSFLLQCGGFQVEAAENGSEATEILLRRRFDLIVTGLNMPKMDGYSLTKSIRAAKGYENTPIMMVSTESDEADKSKGYAAGVNVYVVKPATKHNLVTNAKMLLGN